MLTTPKPRFATTWLIAHPSPDIKFQAHAGILVDLEADQVLWARDEHARRAPASLAKLMTAMVATDLVASLDETVTVPAEATRMEPNLMGLSPGEVVPVRDLLYGLLLDSGNDAAETLASGLLPRDQFIDAMNFKAARLGLSETHFTNPTGLDEPDFYSTAYDLAVMAGHFLDHYAELGPITATKERLIPGSAMHKSYDPYNLNNLLRSYPGATGLKTGFTDDAGGCLAGSAVRNGRRLVAIVLGSDVFVGDATRLLDYGFAQGVTRATA